jgi:hypothetical protein
MSHLLPYINYLAVFVVAIIGFLFGWLWYSPWLFGKIWRAELNISGTGEGMTGRLIKGFVLTLLSAFGLAMLLVSNRSTGLIHGGAYAAFIGLFVSALRILNNAVWEKRSIKLMAIFAGHEVLLFALQGAILGVWR